MNKLHGQKPASISDQLPVPLQNRLNIIIQTIPGFWEQRIYTHFTNHGPEHSERVLYQKIAQLAQELPMEQRLSEDEIFILSASAWLYEIGMQSPSLQPMLDFPYDPRFPLTTDQLLQIREHKHLLTQRLIIDSIRSDYEGPPLHLGLSRPPDDYIRAIMEVCRWCSPEPLDLVDSTFPVSGIEVRLRLMVALLRLADQLYIDGSRVNLNQLLAFHLPHRVEARWWAYHYTQTLPIDKGKIRFYYSIPIAQKQYLGHIRALIEPTFEYENNPIIQYLRDVHDLRLSVQQQPQVRLDQQVGFLQEMPRDMLAFLRAEVDPIKTEGHNVELIGPAEEKASERRPLLVLDYENMLLQLGQDGYFPTPEELKKLVISLTIKANDLFEDVVDRWALGHWQRPDFQAAKRELEPFYELKTLYDDQKSATLLQDEFAHLLQRTNAPTNTLLVAPREELIPIITQFTDRKLSIAAWLCDFSEVSLFRMLIRNIRPLDQVVQLPAQFEYNGREELQELCILKLDDALQGKSRSSIPIIDVAPLLNGFSELGGHGEWWKMWLLKQEILYFKETQQHYGISLNSSHEAVNLVQHKRSIVIKSAQRLASDRQEISQAVLLSDLDNAPQFRGRPEQTARFCQFLQSGGILQPVPDHEGSRWRLNSAHWSVLAENADLYLPLLVIGIDHFLLREGFQYIHEHILAGKLANYVGYSTAQAIYHLARDRGMVRSRVSSRKFRDSDKYMVEVQLVEEHEEVRKALRHRNLLLLGLYNRGSCQGLSRDTLWNNLMEHMRRCFTLSRQAFEHWLSVFQRDGILKSSTPDTQPERILLHLNLEAPLVVRLLGRLNVLNLIKSMRIMGAWHQAKSTQEIIDQMTKYITHDRQLATLTLQYARDRGLVESSRQTSGEKTIECEKLRNSPFIRALDSRNFATCSALAELVGSMKHKFPLDRVPENKLIQEMEQDSRFGIAHEEYRYWINQSVHQHKLLLEHRGERVQGYVNQSYYSVKPKVQEQK